MSPLRRAVPVLLALLAPAALPGSAARVLFPERDIERIHGAES